MALGSVAGRRMSVIVSCIRKQAMNLQSLGTSGCKTELSRRNILADSGTNQMVQRTLVLSDCSIRISPVSS
jgi:hypothetical protein